MTSANKNLNQARISPNDEFYTRYDDIEWELNHYRHPRHFKDKIVLCNCDDPEYSNFYKHFKAKFNIFGLKKLIAIHYSYDQTPSYKLTYTHINGVLTETKTALRGNGDFRSDECIELLKEADVVVTNPPFSLFREYVAQLMEYDKKFLIVGNLNAITYKEIFPLIKDNKIWFGYTFGKSVSFIIPEEYETKVDKRDAFGNKLTSMGNITWFTNLDIPKRHETLHLFAPYNPEDYPKYDNYDAINVNRVVRIPRDYDGVMGVPITFLGSYNPAQFEIIGGTANGQVPDKYKIGNFKSYNNPIIKGKKIYQRILIRPKKGVS